MDQGFSALRDSRGGGMCTEEVLGLGAYVCSLQVEADAEAGW